MHAVPPAILPSRLFSQMLTLRGNAGPRAIILNDAHVEEITMPAASKDVDQPSDLKPATRDVSR